MGKRWVQEGPRQMLTKQPVNAQWATHLRGGWVGEGSGGCPAAQPPAGQPCWGAA